MGIKWKVLSYLAVFIAVLLVLLWLFQTVFLDSFYRMVKTRGIHTAADSLVRQLDSDSLTDTAESLSQGEDICVLILDESYAVLCSAEAGRGCAVHNAGLPALIRMVTAAEEAGGSVTLMQDEMLPGTGGPGGPLLPDTDGYSAAQGGAGDSQPLPAGEEDAPDRPQSMVYVRLAQRADGSRAALLLATVITPVDATVSTLRIQLVCITLLLTLLAVGLAFLISRRISRPIIRLNDAAGLLAAGRYDAHFPGGGYREIDELAATLRYAAKELSTVEGLRRELIANVSHDLRTPLTMIIGYSEAMRDIPGENTPENVQIIIEEARRLTRLVEDMLDLSRLQSGAAAISPAAYDLTASLRDMCGRIQKLAGEGFTVRLEAAESAFVYADEGRISQVVYNLVGNALAHGGTDRMVLVRQRLVQNPAGPAVRVEVEDHGPGIPADELPHIFDRYYRLDGDRPAAGDGPAEPVTGTGLGLSIVRSILELHGAAYGVDSAPGRGSRFWFELPLAPPAGREGKEAPGA